MPQELIDKIDAHRDASSESRSEYIRDAVKQRMAEEDAENGA
ncbi:ribbon-helix-helix domain-containing protein [Halorussus vallis]|nr:ribbon-helix-helix protein, CopG family [Halorussus vallis]USZ75689.1 ribbon-helix-helix domain-containing protein [Halorussus vallis]USZ75764.1 ribbon-helix-helix domain-containing protein [Halorussus vallis]